MAGPGALRNVECALTDEWRSKNFYEKQKQDLDKDIEVTKENAWKVKTTLLPNELYPDIWIAEKAIDIIKNKKDEEPWFLWISFVEFMSLLTLQNHGKGYINLKILKNQK